MKRFISVLLGLCLFFVVGVNSMPGNTDPPPQEIHSFDCMEKITADVTTGTTYTRSNECGVEMGHLVMFNDPVVITAMKDDGDLEPDYRWQFHPPLYLPSTPPTSTKAKHTALMWPKGNSKSYRCS